MGTASKPFRARWRRPVAVAVVVFVVGFCLSWLGFGLGDAMLEGECGVPMREGDGFSFDTALWPPGQRCTVVTMDGVRHEHIHVPWEEWLNLALTAASMGFATAAAQAKRHRILLAGTSVALAFAAFALYFELFFEVRPMPVPF